MMRILFDYLKCHKKSALLSVVFVIIFSVINLLEETSLKSVFYAVMLCFFIGLIIATVDYYFFYTRHNNLKHMVNKISVSIKNLPSPNNIIEKDYQELITVLNDDKANITFRMDNRYSNMMNYYTMWVHQIKTPIAAMRLLLQSDPSQSNQELMQELFKIEQYVDMVLQYLRIDSDFTDYVIRRYSIDRIIRKSVKHYANQFIRKKIFLDYQPINQKVLTDEKWIVFVIEQILSNALKYTNEGKVSVYMQEKKTLVIEDTGIGINKEDISRVFEKGFTGYNGRINEKATGIGLYLCRKICSKLGHTISIESEIGEWTKVKITFEYEDVVIE